MPNPQIQLQVARLRGEIAKHDQQLVRHTAQRKQKQEALDHLLAFPPDEKPAKPAAPASVAAKTDTAAAPAAHAAVNPAPAVEAAASTK